MLTPEELQQAAPLLRWFPLELPEEPRVLAYISQVSGEWFEYIRPQPFISGAYAARYDGWLIVYCWYPTESELDQITEMVFMAAPEYSQEAATALFQEMFHRRGLRGVVVRRTNIPLAEYPVQVALSGQNQALLVAENATFFDRPYFPGIPAGRRNFISVHIHFYAAIIESFLRPRREELGSPRRRA